MKRNAFLTLFIFVFTLIFAVSGFTTEIETADKLFTGKVTLQGPVSVTGSFSSPADNIKQSSLNRRYILEEFESNPITSLLAGGASAGTDTGVCIMAFEENIFEYQNIGTQTIIAPSLAAGGLNITRDLTNDEGIEITQGITSRSRSAFVVGTDAFYLKVRFTITDVSGTDDCLVGFRTSEAYQAAVDNYNNMAALNVISGNIYMETIDDNAATTSTDTTDNWADAATKTLEVYVGKNRKVTYLINGVAPTTSAAFTWDSGDTVVPFFYFLNAADVAETTYLVSWECGLIE